MLNGPEEDLNQTKYAQPAVCANSIIVINILRVLAFFRAFTHRQERLGLSIPSFSAMVMGHSLGEYSALYAAEAISLPDVIKLTVRSHIKENSFSTL